MTNDPSSMNIKKYTRFSYYNLLIICVDGIRFYLFMLLFRVFILSVYPKNSFTIDKMPHKRENNFSCCLQVSTKEIKGQS